MLYLGCPGFCSEGLSIPLLNKESSVYFQTTEASTQPEVVLSPISVAKPSPELQLPKWKASQLPTSWSSAKITDYKARLRHDLCHYDSKWITALGSLNTHLFLYLNYLFLSLLPNLFSPHMQELQEEFLFRQQTEYPWESWKAHASTNIGAWVSKGQHCLRLCEQCLGKLRHCKGAAFLLVM